MARDLFLFALILIWASAGQLLAKDLIWGLWISSLTVGYATILAMAVIPVLTASSLGNRIAGILGGLFFIAFFSVHFGGSHFVHGLFLAGFFPPFDQAPSSGPNPAIYPRLLPYLLGAYWPMIAASAWMAMGTWKEAWRGGIAFHTTSGTRAGPKGDLMMRPYANVIRMHFLIFIFAGMKIAGLDGLIVYPVLLLYFFPWQTMFRGMKSRRSPQARPQTMTDPADQVALAAIEEQRRRLPRGTGTGDQPSNNCQNDAKTPQTKSP
jgi:hypothetical protein